MFVNRHMLLLAGLRLHRICQGNTLSVWLATLHLGLVVERWYVITNPSVPYLLGISLYLNWMLQGKRTCIVASFTQCCSFNFICKLVVSVL